MGRRLNRQEAIDEACKYLRLAVLMLDGAAEFGAAIHVAVALETVSGSEENVRRGSQLAEDMARDEAGVFEVSWGTLTDLEKAFTPA